MKAKLYFATNRNHEGGNRWRPKSYGKHFSSDGHYNLRFGELTIDYNAREASNLLKQNFGEGRVGNGEQLSEYLSKQAKNASIRAYNDATPTARKTVPFEKNSSTRMFKSLKSRMEQANDVLVYIHGYNVEWEEAVGGALAMEMMINRNKARGEKRTMVVLFSWPSNGSMMPFAAYKSDRSDARDSANAVARAFLKLRDFLSRIQVNANDRSMRPCNNNIHLLCHSMGNYVLQNALKKVKGYSNGRMPRLFEHIFLCAPDVDDDVLEKGERMGDVHQLCTHLTVYYNNGDVALNISDHTKGNPPRLGNSGSAHPHLVHNKIHQVDCTPIVKGLVEHSYHLWATVNDDIVQTLDEMPFDSNERRRKRLANSREWKLW